MKLREVIPNILSIFLLLRIWIFGLFVFFLGGEVLMRRRRFLLPAEEVSSKLGKVL